MMIYLASVIILTVSLLVNVAFFTLLERKILGLSQNRKGPNKVSFTGILQPAADAVKLFSKEQPVPNQGNNALFLLGPLVSICISLLLWAALPWSWVAFPGELTLLLILVVMSLGVYGIFLGGWRSNSKYAFLGALRGIAQTVSYEIPFSLVIVTLFIATAGLSLNAHLASSSPFLLLILSPTFLVWLTVCLRESNRTPFDFAEGESELVSGFNVEYAAGLFSIIFIAEYASIIMLRALTSMAMLTTSGLSFLLVTFTMIFWWVWARATLPRFRYDLLIELNWKAYIPLTTIFFAFYLSLAF